MKILYNTGPRWGVRSAVSHPCISKYVWRCYVKVYIARNTLKIFRKSNNFTDFWYLPIIKYYIIKLKVQRRTQFRFRKVTSTLDGTMHAKGLLNSGTKHSITGTAPKHHETFLKIRNSETNKTKLKTI